MNGDADGCERFILAGWGGMSVRHIMLIDGCGGWFETSTWPKAPSR